MASTIDRILAHEPQAIAWTRQAAPDYVRYAEDAFEIMCNAVQGYSGPATLFRATWVHARKSAGLAVLSALRQHRVENAQNLRQLIEMTSLFGYVAIHPEIAGGWGKANATGEEIRASNEQYRVDAINWLKTQHPGVSAGLKFFKDHINSNLAHGTILNTGHVYDYAESEVSDQRFFDIPIVDDVKLSMFMTGRTIATALALLVLVEPRSSIVTNPTLRGRVVELEQRATGLHDDLDATYAKG